MLRLYLRFYVALLASLVVFGIAIASIWHYAGGPVEKASGALSRLVQNVLPPVAAPAAEQQQALGKIAAGLNGDVTLYDRKGTVIASIGGPLQAPPDSVGEQSRTFSRSPGGTVSAVRMADGRLLVASVPIEVRDTRQLFHLMLLLLLVMMGIAAYPIVRQLTRRLERLQQGVDSLGAGDLSARVAVEGHDEVARLAESFNKATTHIEQLVRSHRLLLANASHEFRTPLARIRLGLELLSGSVDEKSQAGLKQDIAELDELVDEILLASRLDAVQKIEASEEIDLLALAAEECARYDDVQLDGAAITIRGDARLLRRLLRNLLENAKRHGAPPTQVRLSRDANSVVLTVWDGGKGPAPNELEQLFTPFYRPADGRNRVGTGLGLSLVRQIARLHAGDARCVIMDDGRASFVVTLAG